MEFKNIIKLLESEQEANIFLGLTLAKNYPEAFKQHYGEELKNYEIILDWFWKKMGIKANPFTATKLDLSKQRLSKLPEQIHLFKKVTQLNLDFNLSLKALTCDDIGKIIHLEFLYLGHCGLENLPPEIRALQNLKSLGLTDNYINDLPREIGQLQGLRTLDLSDNQLVTLPPEIGQLQALELLSLNYNQLSALPPEIGQLQALEHLDLSHNQLQSLPDCLADMPHVKIYVAGNPDLKLSEKLEKSGKVFLTEETA